MRYVVSHAIYGFRRAKRHEYNIAKTEGFYIAFFLKISHYRRGFSKENIAVRPVSQYRLSFLMTLSNSESVIFKCKKRRQLPYEVSPFTGGTFILHLIYIVFMESCEYRRGFGACARAFRLEFLIALAVDYSCTLTGIHRIFRP